MNERFKALRNILLEAVEIRDPVERAAFVAGACGPDVALRREVEQLLQAEAASGQFLPDQPAGGGKLAATRGDTEALGDGTDTRKAAITEMPGERIGRYKLLQKIGEGGCGIVYMAEQETPVRRRVALKVIKLGMDTKQVVARFEAERQALALMDHPNIAKVLDGGATEAGRPFFVMELVRGIPVTRYCDENRLSTRQRLELLIQVCQAIQHAHQKGIVHRDIKPSNILVTELDGAAVPKVIDFGIAKATSGQILTDKTLFTAFEQFIGTPAYMSPEQAQLSGAEIDARSDVYSLGVLLYELLTGKTPFDPKRLVKAGFDEVRRIIREEDPPRPSTRLSSLELAEQTTVARDRQCDPPRLVKAIRGDLDWIVMNTLEKSRARRYQTPHGLGEDIQRFLQNDAVQARPPSTLYRLGKLVRRHHVAVSAASVVLLTLVAAGVVVTFAFKSSRGEGPVVSPDLKRIAILPFTNASPDRLEEYLSDSLRSELISGLRKAPGLNAFTAPAMLESMPEGEAVRLLAQLGVPLLVKGSLEEKDGQIKLTGRLIDTGAGSELVPATCERELKRSLGMPNELALAIAKQCGGALPAEVRKRIQQTPTQNPEAYEYYLQGRFQHERFALRGGIGNAIPLLKRAVDLDPKFAQAWAELGRAYVSEYFYFHPERTSELQPKAREAIENAFKADPELPEGHFAYGYFLWTPSQGWQHAAAMREYQLALKRNPHWEEAAHQLTLIYLHVGLLEKGGERANRAIADNPVSHLPQYLLANALFWQGNNSNAVAAWTNSPGSLQANWIMNSYLAAALVNLGRTNEATAVIDKALTADRGDRGGLFASVRALLLAKQGDEVGATNQIALALQQNPGYGHLHHGLYNIASAWALLNKPEPALTFLSQAANEGFPCYPLFKADPNLNSLRKERAFIKFLTKQKRIHEQFEADFGKGSS